MYARSSQNDQGSPESAEGARVGNKTAGFTIPTEVIRRAEEVVRASQDNSDPATAEMLRYLGSFIIRSSGSQETQDLALCMPGVEDAMWRLQHPDPMITKSRNNRVTAKDFWHLPCSATDEEAMAMAKKKAQERQLKEAVVEERRADRESKKRREVTDAIKRSEALLLEISSQGPSRLSTMVL